LVSNRRTIAHVKLCSRCGELKPYSEFHRYNRGDGFQVWCKACRKIYDRQYCQRNQGRWQSRKNEFKRQRRQWLRELKTDKPCADCGRVFPPEAMEWDHRPGTVKLFEVSMMPAAALNWFSKRSRNAIWFVRSIMPFERGLVSWRVWSRSGCSSAW
jgi:hypothetical protein